MLAYGFSWGRRGRDRMVVGFTTTYAISAYHHWCCAFESRSERGVQHYAIKCASDLRQVGGSDLASESDEYFPYPIRHLNFQKIVKKCL